MIPIAIVRLPGTAASTARADDDHARSVRPTRLRLPLHLSRAAAAHHLRRLFRADRGARMSIGGRRAVLAWVTTLTRLRMPGSCDRYTPACPGATVKSARCAASVPSAAWRGRRSDSPIRRLDLDDGAARAARRRARALSTLLPTRSARDVERGDDRRNARGSFTDTDVSPPSTPSSRSNRSHEHDKLRRLNRLLFVANVAFAYRANAITGKHEGTKNNTGLNCVLRQLWR